ncbi:hypothetical protein GE061_011468 [Apolygus lucorum]|uniref:PDZ domain-containing protein n=1 Tax=Apolygus lucorum TaxID=248454 RepID=A0A8S9Y093_APOLU|nr:hypothetical protein GE061_011468 [Apolygus lucorum]
MCRLLTVNLHMFGTWRAADMNSHVRYSIFNVMVKKGSGGLGLSVAGGEPWPGLIRIKRLFPHQPASHSGLLSPGDILLAASGVPLLGLTNYEALEVLRSSPSEVKLTVCRPPEPVVAPVETVAPPPPPRDHPIPPLHDQYGEFEILMEKVNGSLGFTLRKEDQSVLGHYVRALVREPALSDPRIRPGDKIVAVNDVEMSNLTHEEAVAFLRQCGELVRLRLYRDPAQTPVPSHSPTHSHRTFKPILRKEAQDMLSELAVKKSQSPQESSGSSKSSSPRKRRLTRTPPPAERSDSLESTIEEARLAKVEQSPSLSEKKITQFSSNLATQSSEEELVATGLSGNEPPPSEPVSMPPMSTLEQETGSGFSYRNPAYRSANQPISKSMTAQEIQDNGCSEQDIPNAVEGTKSLIKWKGVILCGEDGDRSEATISELAHSESMSSQQSQEVLDGPEYQVIIVELNRGWNSRLGFSLQSADSGGSVISAIYSDSVASRDGRLRIGDRLINVNDDNIDGMDTSDESKEKHLGTSNVFRGGVLIVIPNQFIYQKVQEGVKLLPSPSGHYKNIERALRRQSDPNNSFRVDNRGKIREEEKCWPALFFSWSPPQQQDLMYDTIPDCHLFT